MKIKRVLIALFVLSLLIGCVNATNVKDFKINGPVKELSSNDNYVVYIDNDSDAGLAIYRITDKVRDDHEDDDDAIDNFVHDDGDNYLIPDDDVHITKNSDNTANFTDADHATRGISEVIDNNGEKHVVVFWSKNSSDMDMDKLSNALHKFNKDNNLSTIAF